MKLIRSVSWVLIILAITALAAGCSDKIGAEDAGRVSLTVYYAASGELEESGSAVAPLSVPVNENADVLHAALRLLSTDPGVENYSAALPEGLEILSYSLTGTVITVDLSSGYNQMTPVSKTIAKACIVLTLCALDEVDGVSIYVEGIPEELNLDADSVMLPDSGGNSYEQQLTLYFPDSEKDFLYTEQRILTIGMEKNICDFMMDELIRGPQEQNLISALPEGTRTNYVEVNGNICTVDLSQEFVLNKPETAAEERLALYTIVNSLCTINGVEAVQITIDGDYCQKYLYIDIAHPLKPEKAILFDSYKENEDIKQTVYMRLFEGKLVPLTILVGKDAYMTQEETAIRALLAAEPAFGYLSAISAGVELQTVTLANGVCTVVFNDVILIAGNTSRHELMLDSIVDTIAACGNADRVIIMGGAQYVSKNIYRIASYEKVVK